MSRKEFAGLIVGARDAKGLSQVQLAAKVKVSSQQVSRWERGASLPAPKILPCLARVLDLDITRVYELYALASQEETRNAQREVSEAKKAMATVKEFVDTYQDFHAAYQKMGVQVDQLVMEIAEIKRIVLGRDPPAPS